MIPDKISEKSNDKDKFLLIPFPSNSNIYSYSSILTTENYNNITLKFRKNSDNLKAKVK